MQVRCIRARAGVKAGDLAEVPDGAEVSPLYFEVVEPPPAPRPSPSQPPAAPAAAPADAKGMAS